MIKSIPKADVLNEVVASDFVSFDYNGKQRRGIVELVKKHRPTIARTSINRDYITLKHFNPSLMDDKVYSNYTIARIESADLMVLSVAEGSCPKPKQMCKPS